MECILQYRVGTMRKLFIAFEWLGISFACCLDSAAALASAR